MRISGSSTVNTRSLEDAGKGSRCDNELVSGSTVIPQTSASIPTSRFPFSTLRASKLGRSPSLERFPSEFQTFSISKGSVERFLTILSVSAVYSNFKSCSPSRTEKITHDSRLIARTSFHVFGDPPIKLPSAFWQGVSGQ